MPRSPSPKQSRSPTSVCLTYPANDYVPERPPTPQYIYNQQSINQYNNQLNTQSKPLSSSNIYINQQQRSTSKTINKKKNTDFTSIDDWHRKMTDDFNELYSTLERNFELKKLRDTGKLVSPIPPSESKKEQTGYRTAKELYLDQTTISSPKPSRKYYLESSSNKPLSASNLFNEHHTSYKSNQSNIVAATTKCNAINKRNWLDSTNKLNRFNSSQDLNYLNPNNKFNDLNNNQFNVDDSFRKSAYQHSSLDNLNSNLISNYDQPIHDFSYKIYAQPTTTR